MAVATTGTLSTNRYVDAVLDGGDKWTGGLTPDGRTIITMNFIGFGAAEPDWTEFWEDGAFFAAAVGFERVCNIDLVHTMDTATADIRIQTGPSSIASLRLLDASGPAYGVSDLPSSQLGRPAPVQQVRTAFNTDPFLDPGANTSPTGWSQDGVAKGGFGYWTIIHELGHALGLMHPFPEGSPAPTNRPLAATDVAEDSLLTMMSYSTGGLNPTTGWYDLTRDQTYVRDTATGATLLGHGYLGGPSVIDIAALQVLYGANRTIAGGNDTYRLTDGGTDEFWQTLWDTGGVDQIVYGGTRACRISLAPVSLEAPITTASVANTISQAKGINGGFLIADDLTDALPDRGRVQGVIIENATGGSGNDTLRGNGVDNILSGRNGQDKLYGGRGNDTLLGGKLKDTLAGSFGQDTLTGGLGNDVFVLARGQGKDQVTDFHNSAGDNDRLHVSLEGLGGGLTSGTLAASQFRSRGDNHAQDLNDRFIFRTSDATLWFDANGSSAGGLSLLADLQGGARMTSGDVLLI
ncbi:M10 family metallopeptidase C-terminal domain-containing protein [Rubellimicrobium arenae]|uniref:M10 family metallopeptidase C-terminal domain-containing protein n=1 Tax=Rubellimicrobium arenae TaxID=2817372 RepID=UPI0026E576A8|nr:hypothetical protein [Rubellimicrobium arenae]